MQGAVLAGLAVIAAYATPSKTKENILFIMTDDQVSLPLSLCALSLPILLSLSLTSKRYLRVALGDTTDCLSTLMPLARGQALGTAAQPAEPEEG